MKTTILCIVAGILLCMSVQVQATNSTPTNNYGVYMDLNAFHTGTRPNFAEALGENNYSLAVIMCATPMDTGMDPANYVPESTFISVKNQLMLNAGGGINHSHGSTTGWGVQFYPHCTWGDSLRTIAVNDIVSLGWGGEIGLQEDPGVYYSISIKYSGYSNYMVLANAIWYNQTCNGSSGGQWPGSAVTLAPSGTCSGSDSINNDIELAKNMNGDRGLAKRMVSGAIGDCPNLTKLGLGDRTLTPAVSAFSHSSGHMIPEGGQATFTFTTDTHCNTGIPAFSVDGDLTLVSSGWTSTTSFQATVGGYQVGSGYLMMNGHSNNCISLPMKDEYWVWIRHGSDGNTGASFEKFNAFDEGEETHISWVTNPEDGSLYFDVYGGSNRQTLLATVPAAGSLVRPHYYEVTVPIGYDVFEVVETDDDPGTEYTSRPFRLQQRPEDISQLRQLNQEVVNWPAHTVDQPAQENTALSIPATTMVTDFVFYSSRSDLLTQSYDVANAWENLGYTTQMIQWSSDPYEARATMQAIYEMAIAENYPRLPVFVIIGEANQGDHPERNVVGTIYVEDESGNCYWPGLGCSSDALIVDFDGDQLPDVPWKRVVASTNEEMSNCVETTLDFFNGYHVQSPRRALFLDGDLTFGCDADPDDPRRTLMEVKAQYDNHSIQTVVLHESNYDCYDFDTRLIDASAAVNNGISELVGSGLITSLNRWPGFFFQRASSPYFTMDDIATPQRVIVHLPGCGLANCDGDVFDYPSIAKRWLVANPDVYTTAVEIYGASNGGFRARHMQFAEAYFDNRFRISMPNYLNHFRSIRQIGEKDPYAYEYLRFCLALGFPVPVDPMSVVSVDDPDVPIPQQLGLSNAPNPFNPRTTIQYALTGLSRVDLSVYDIRGCRVATLVSNKVQLPGEYDVIWIGRDDNDRQLASGVYFARLDISGRTSLVHKMTLLK
jgi:hypothetical protein